ncbi:unnamed protein product [Acanthoscelides obtectus]|uniref:Uncharacterized protein n=1 Tax=Acanthoscelides obtectus TaxID=200917 RepID=A0A9P0QBU0_ACAOB|nr:unnamed protein product [Acanthoscelides obtectus]CAK1633380.1 hypothetical protein AOBTE_LOCUS8089 [Acanthoscelides obtectus]
MNSRTLKMIQLVGPKKSEGTQKAGIQNLEKRSLSTSFTPNAKQNIGEAITEEYVQEDDGGSTTSNNQAHDVPKIPSSARSIAQMMQDSITQQPPLFLMPWESSTTSYKITL